MILNPAQSEAVPFVRRELEKGGEMFYDAPVGVGKMIVVAEAIRDIPRVAYVSRIPELVAQFKFLCDKMGLTNVTFVKPRTGLVGTFEVIIADASAKDIRIDHPCVLRCS